MSLVFGIAFACRDKACADPERVSSMSESLSGKKEKSLSPGPE